MDGSGIWTTWSSANEPEPVHSHSPEKNISSNIVGFFFSNKAVIVRKISNGSWLSNHCMYPSGLPKQRSDPRGKGRGRHLYSKAHGEDHSLTQTTQHMDKNKQDQWHILKFQRVQSNTVSILRLPCPAWACCDKYCLAIILTRSLRFSMNTLPELTEKPHSKAWEIRVTWYQWLYHWSQLKAAQMVWLSLTSTLHHLSRVKYIRQQERRLASAISEGLHPVTKQLWTQIFLWTACRTKWGEDFPWYQME